MLQPAEHQSRTELQDDLTFAKRQNESGIVVKVDPKAPRSWSSYRGLRNGPFLSLPTNAHTAHFFSSLILYTQSCQILWCLAKKESKDCGNSMDKPAQNTDRSSSQLHIPLQCITRRPTWCCKLRKEDTINSNSNPYGSVLCQKSRVTILLQRHLTTAHILQEGGCPQRCVSVQNRTSMRNASDS